jgi:phosphoribosylaminoimidazole (AIR) synthetase
VPALFHTILFAYQKKLNEVLSSGEAIFVHPVLATISKIDRKSGLSVIRGGTLAKLKSSKANNNNL